MYYFNTFLAGEAFIGKSVFSNSYLHLGNRLVNISNLPIKAT